MKNKVLIVDFGSTYTQLIARMVRGLNIYSEIFPFNKLPENAADYGAVILSGQTVSGEDASKIDLSLIKGKKPLLEILYGDSTKEPTKGEETYRLQFSPAAEYAESGSLALKNFLTDVSGLKQDWTPESFVETSVKDLRRQIGGDKVVLGLSGGVDSTVSAVLLKKAIGDRLTCIFVNSGVLRLNEFENVLEAYKGMGLNITGVDASDRFYKALKGLADPEAKRKAIGRTFIDVFDEEAGKIKGVAWLGQGTIYPDVIESFSVRGGDSVAVKSHHNVGGLPAYMKLKVVEPLRALFKDEVRRVGASLAVDKNILGRHPFPGPGLSIRILGEVTAEKVKLLQQVDDIFISKLRSAGLYDRVWQAGAILLPVKSVGIAGDERTYENAVALRAVNSTDAMTAEWAHLPYDFLAEVSDEIIKRVNGVNRVVYDISSKPPATIEWE